MIKRVLAVFGFVFALWACTDSERSVQTLEQAGFTDIQTTGYVVFACSDDDSYHTGFRAKNARGQPVTGVVCCGVFKSCTVRF